jgi:4-hydroxy-tetrahydrodipicolinate synthase
MVTRALQGGLWSATPTPFTRDLQVDVGSVERMVEHHVSSGVTGLMLAGTCGEGPWLRNQDREVLVQTTIKAAAGRLRVAVHVAENSAGQVLDRIDAAAAAGAEYAVVSPPFFALNLSPDRLFAHYREIARHSPIPIGLYDRGAASPYVLPESHFDELFSEPAIVLVKDSSTSVARRDRYLEVRRQRPGLLLFSGDEFSCVEYLRAGYDGLLLGGAIFNARLAGRIMTAVRAGDFDSANRNEQRMRDLMHRVYGGPKIECWLTGLKELLVQMKVFSTSANLLGYPLTEICRSQIRAAVTGSDGLGFAVDLLGPLPLLATHHESSPGIRVALP